MVVSPALFERHVDATGLTVDQVKDAQFVALDEARHPEPRLDAVASVLAWLDLQRWRLEELTERHRLDSAAVMQRLQRKERALNLALFDLNAILRCMYLDALDAKRTLSQILEDRGAVTGVLEIESRPRLLGKLRASPDLPLIDRRCGGTVPANELVAELSRRIMTWQAARTLTARARAAFDATRNPTCDERMGRIQRLHRAIAEFDAVGLELLRERLAIECAELYRDLVREAPVDAWKVAGDQLERHAEDMPSPTLRLWSQQRVQLANRILADDDLRSAAQDEGVLRSLETIVAIERSARTEEVDEDAAHRATE